MTQNVTMGSGGLKSAEKVSRIIWMAPLCIFFKTLRCELSANAYEELLTL
jgi:hypothetical protein